MSEPKFQIGDDLYVRDPSRFEPGSTCITGRVSAIGESRHRNGVVYHLDAYIGRPGGGFQQPSVFAEKDVGLRLGIPISQLSGRVNEAGYEAFKQVAASWGYD